MSSGSNLGLHGNVQGKSADPYRIMANFGVDDIHEMHRHLTSRRRGVHSPAGTGTLGRLGSHLQGPRRQRPSAIATALNARLGTSCTITKDNVAYPRQPVHEVHHDQQADTTNGGRREV